MREGLCEEGLYVGGAVCGRGCMWEWLCGRGCVREGLYVGVDVWEGLYVGGAV